MDLDLKRKSSWLILLFWALLFLSRGTYGDSSGISLKFLRTPSAISNRKSAVFVFEIIVNGDKCPSCSTICKLDNRLPSECDKRRVFYPRLKDGSHRVEVCANVSQAVGCLDYDWIVDTVAPTAHLTAAAYFTSALYVPVNISFSEPCGGDGGFQCSANACNLLVYGDGQVVPNTLNVIQPNLQFSISVSLSTSAQFGRAVVVMDKSFCTDSAGNKFTRTENSSLFIHFDRRRVNADLRTHLPEKFLEVNKETRTVLATNKTKNLKIYLYFSEPVLNSSAEILSSLNTDQGSLVPINRDDFDNRRFGFQVKDISQTAVITVNLVSNWIISRQGTPVSPVAPVAFLYDSERPAVWLRTTSARRTRDKVIPVLIKFMKPVFGFNSSHITFSGGHLKRFQTLSWSMYALDVETDDGSMSITIPENVTNDVSGNGNLASNTLQVWHYTVPSLSMSLSSFTTAAFALTSLAAGVLTVSTASLQSLGAFTTPSPSLTSDPARNIFRIAGHIQVFALSRWLAVTLPVEFYEFARGIQWSIPYFDLPWETAKPRASMEGSNFPYNPHPYALTSIFTQSLKTIRQGESLTKATRLYGLPLSAVEYRTLFQGQNVVPEAQDILDPQNSHGWRDFKRSMFWLAVIYGSLEFLHALLLLILRVRKKSGSSKSYSALLIPRFEIFLLILALPCVCKASAALIKGGAPSGITIGALLLGLVLLVLLSLLLFLSIGITLGKLLQYKEVHKVEEKFHWYQELIRVTLGPGKRGQWTWKNQPDSKYLSMLGPLFEDLRGPPKYMLSQITGGTSNKRDNRIIASDDETEDAEAPFIQKLFGILRIYYTLLEAVKRVSLGIVAGAYSEDWSSKTPTTTLLCIASFQLFFMVLKKPFIKKRVQLVEIISVCCEVCLFATCMVLLKHDFSAEHERKIGIFMLSLFLLAFLVQMINQWYSLIFQIKHLDPADDFLTGLKTALIGFVLFFIPSCMIKNLDQRFPLKDSRNSRDLNTNSSNSRSSEERPWMRQLRELAKASFSKEGSGIPNDPSTSQSRWSGFWNGKRSGSPSMSSSSDFKVKPRGLYKDLEAIFASK